MPQLLWVIFFFRLLVYLSATLEDLPTICPVSDWFLWSRFMLMHFTNISCFSVQLCVKQKRLNGRKSRRDTKGSRLLFLIDQVLCSFYIKENKELTNDSRYFYFYLPYILPMIKA